MDENLIITILSENTVERRGLKAEHGLSFYINYKGKEYLFDTGQGLVLLSNAEKLNIDLKNIDTVFLSHSHDDHTGGLKQILDLNPKINIAAHKNIFFKKYKKTKSGVEFIGIELEKSDIKNFIDISDKSKVINDIYSTGTVQTKNNDYIKEKYVIKKDNNKLIDNFHDDISIYFKTQKGLVILLGCSHKGVINILKHIRKKAPGERIRAILGGMHLKHSSIEDVKRIINYLDEINFELLVPIHCTGRKPAMMMKDQFGDRVKLASVGDEFKF